MKQKKEINFRDRKLLFVDLETTGLDIYEHEIVEIGILVVDGRTLKITNKYHSRIKPKHLNTADPEGLKISGYSEKKWKDAREIKPVLKEIATLAPDAMVAGWKVDFDWYMLDKYFKKYKIEHSFDYHLIDVISMAYVHFYKKKKPKELSLQDACKIFRVPIHEKHSEGIGHNAMDDVIATYGVFKKLMEDEA